MKTEKQHSLLSHIIAFMIVVGIYVGTYVAFRKVFHDLTGLEPQFAIIPWFLSFYFIPRFVKLLAKKI